ncbi:hypothetical protein J4Q44_G00106930 [Coregonus suidteri]|uniref:Uncharacterized protein n=1 Tax=Coregonus suidteri TaxID=861788 RepID=A0AAN8M5H3_9TELE
MHPYVETEIWQWKKHFNIFCNTVTTTYEDENRIRPVILDHCCQGDTLSEVREEGRNLLSLYSPGRVLLALKRTPLTRT